MNYMNNQQYYVMSKKLSKPSNKWQVILHDDDHNTFDHVVTCLMDVCAQNYLQAVSCATLVHQNSRCSVFVDVWDECEDVRTELSDLGLMVTTSKYKKYA
jgi:ATP-dependent Clp protease adaptor protein ClpS